VVFFGLLLLEFELVALELEFVVVEVELLLFLAFADFDFDLAGFEFVAAEAQFFFLDVGVAFTDGGVFLASDDLGDAVEDGKILGLLVAGGGELKPGLFEDAQAGLGEVGLAGGGVFEDLGGGGLGVGCVGEAVFEGGAEVKAVEGGAGEGAFVFLFGEFDDFVVDVVVEPGGDLDELVFGEGGKGGVGMR